MKSIKFASIATLSWALIGCGSGDSGGPAPYSLDDYTDRQVSTQDLTGTWVMVTDIDISATYQGDSGQGDVYLKDYFVITGDETSGYERSACHGRSSQPITVSGSTISLYSGYDESILTGSISENSSATFSTSDSYPYNGGTIDLQFDASMVKISNATNDFVQMSYTSSDGNDSDSLNCFQQTRGDFSGGGYSETFTEIAVNGFYAEKYSGDEPYTAIEFYNGIYLLFDTDYGDSVSFSHTVISSDSELVEFNGLDSVDSVSGTISVELP
ncbi:hypothetical protein NBRC116188_09390 [Oceaniserpentilla sp. 4NH20-0058]|uniref:hypothetical protein n=1 Tax=Oceaniserpentilla sp. 4NH20-0058 TaxID=3127660 RepID=UPI0031055FFB